MITQEEMLKLLSDTTPFKTDPNAPFPRWVRRLIMREWIKAERERRST